MPRDRHHLVADHILSVFAHLWQTSLADTPSLTYVLYYGLRLLLESENATLLGLPRLLVDDVYRRVLLKQCRDDAVLGYFHNEFDAMDARDRATKISPIQNKIGMLLAPPALRCILGQKKPTIDIARLMDNGGVLIANLSKGKLGATGSRLIGATLATTISQVAEERIHIPFEDRRDFMVITDEIQNIATTAFASSLAESRNFRIAHVISHQGLTQLPKELTDALFTNCSTKIVFRSSSIDCQRLAEEMDIDNARTISGTPNYHAWVKVMQNGAPTEPMFMRTLLPEPPTRGRKAAVIAHTRARHTRPRAVVERSIAQQIVGRMPGEHDPGVKARMELAANLQMPVEDKPTRDSHPRTNSQDPKDVDIRSLLKD